MLNRLIVTFSLLVLLGISNLQTTPTGFKSTVYSAQMSEPSDEAVRPANIQKSIPAQSIQKASFDFLPVPQVLSTLMDETFEEVFPSTYWVLEDYSLDGEYFWGKRDCHPYSGSYAGWSVGAGENGNSLQCDTNYPANVDTWAIYGPLSFSTADSVHLTFYLWGRAEPDSDCDYDGLFVGASSDGDTFYGESYCGDWTSGSEQNEYHFIELDLSDWAGMSKVYIAFNFYSDNSISDIGFHIDNLSLTMESESGTPVPPSTNYLNMPLVVRDYPPQQTPTPVVTKTPTLASTIGSPTPTSGLQNLVLNGGFESGSWQAENWFTLGGSRIMSPSSCRSGSYCMEICSMYAGSWWCNPGFSQYITIPNNVVSLNLKFYWRGIGYTPGINSMYAKIYDSTTNYFQTRLLRYEGLQGYMLYSFILPNDTVANLRGKRVELGFFDNRGSNSNCSYFIDDVELIANQ